ncbi:MAG: cell division protein FtsQ/DivIB [Kiritimatiellia bacterium]
MSKNAIRKNRLHAKMKANAIAPANGRRRTILLVLGALVLAALSVGLGLGYIRLRDLYEAQCVITDRERQVIVHTGGNIKTGLVLELFGLTNGNNLAKIDFAARRTKILADHPSFRDLTIRRLPPDRVEITVTAREPVARLSCKGNPRITRVVDAEGMVFSRSANHTPLPTILEKPDETTMPGQRLSGRRLAALRLIEYCQLTEFSAIGILDIDVTGPDFLSATLGNYDRALISWEGMDEQLPGSQRAMESQMRNLLAAIRSRVADSSSSLATIRPVWNVTLPNRCFADLKESIQ